MHPYTERAAALKVHILSTNTRLGPFPVHTVRDDETNVEMLLNDTRLGEYLAGKERDAQIATYLANGGTIKNVELDVATGLVRKNYVKRKGPTGKRSPDPITTGDPKYDMYLNALPHPVRPVVIAQGLDPRELYKEYRTLKKEGMIAKYATEANVEAAKGGA